MCMHRSGVKGKYHWFVSCGCWSSQNKTSFMKIFKCHLNSYISLTRLQWTHGSSWWSSHQGVEIFQRTIEIKKTSWENAHYFKWECPINAHLYIIYFFVILFLYCVNVWNCTMTTTRKTKSRQKNHRNFYVPFWQACLPTLPQSPHDWINIIYFNIRSTQGLLFFIDCGISLC